MAVVLLKPHLLWPLPLLMFAAWVPHRRQAFRFALAAVLTLAAGTLAGFALVPHSGAFFRHVFGFGGRVSAVQPDLSGLPGLLAPIAHGAPIGIAFGLLGIVVVAATAWMGARRARRTDGTVDPTFVPLLGLALWLACTPYAHPCCCTRCWWC